MVEISEETLEKMMMLAEKMVYSGDPVEKSISAGRLYEVINTEHNKTDDGAHGMIKGVIPDYTPFIRTESYQKELDKSIGNRSFESELERAKKCIRDWSNIKDKCNYEIEIIKSPRDKVVKKRTAKKVRK